MIHDHPVHTLAASLLLVEVSGGVIPDHPVNSLAASLLLAEVSGGLIPDHPVDSLAASLLLVEVSGRVIPDHPVLGLASSPLSNLLHNLSDVFLASLHYPLLFHSAHWATLFFLWFLPL